MHPLCGEAPTGEHGCVRWETALRARPAADLASLQRPPSICAVAYLTLDIVCDAPILSLSYRYCSSENLFASVESPAVHQKLKPSSQFEILHVHAMHPRIRVDLTALARPSSCRERLPLIQRWPARASVGTAASATRRSCACNA